MQFKVVLDTNVYISGLITGGGKADQIIRKIENCHLFCAEAIFDEIKRVLHYPKIKNRYRLTENELVKVYLFVRNETVVPYANFKPPHHAFENVDNWKADINRIVEEHGYPHIKLVYWRG